jgi:hypothetical protein
MAPGRLTGDQLVAPAGLSRPSPLTAGGPHQPNPAPMSILEADTDHRCEALTISDIPPYHCATSAIADRKGLRQPRPAHPLFDDARTALPKPSRPAVLTTHQANSTALVSLVMAPQRRNFCS